MEVILQHGANVDFQDKDGQTCLMLSATWGASACLRILLKHHAEVNLVEHEGRTALMHACAPEHYRDDVREEMAMEFVELLLARGANATARDCHGRTAADYAAEHDLHKVEAFLRAWE